MAKKAAPKSTAVVERTANTLPVNWRERVKTSVDKRQRVVDQTPDGGTFISLKGGIISQNGNPLPNPLPIIVLSSIHERAYYEGAYTGEGGVPSCYSRHNSDLPHPSIKEPQSKSCADCEHNEFGTAENGKGKACKEGLKLAVIASDEVAKGRAETTPIASVKLSVMNRKAFAGYMRKFDDQTPSWGVETMLHNEPDPKNQYKVSFTKGLLDADDDTMLAIANREAEAEALLEAPYPPPREPAPKGRPNRFAKRGK